MEIPATIILSAFKYTNSVNLILSFHDNSLIRFRLFVETEEKPKFQEIPSIRNICTKKIVF